MKNTTEPFQIGVLESTLVAAGYDRDYAQKLAANAFAYPSLLSRNEQLEKASGKLVETLKRMYPGDWDCIKGASELNALPTPEEKR